MNYNRHTAISKRLSYVLRHRPDSIGLRLDQAGWADIEDLLDGLALRGKAVSRDELDEVVKTNPKQRFEIDESGTQIRARQGHSVRVQLGYEPEQPPDLLFHGTPEANLDSILRVGLDKRRRHHVHMSTDRALMLEVARRRGEPVLLRIDARAMHVAGHVFYVTANDVWLTDSVPPQYLSADLSASGDQPCPNPLP